MMPQAVSTSPWYENIRADFPVLQQHMNGKILTYMDSASSAQKPQAVINAMTGAMEGYYANIHRGLYAHSQQMTSEYEAVRGKAQNLINAASNKEIIFTRNTTDAINLVAQSWGGANLGEGDEIILTEMEHHANIVPWQLLQSRLGFVIKTIPLDVKTGRLDLEVLPQLLSKKTKLLAFVHASNVLGTLNPAKEMIAQATAYNPSIITMLDASQSIVHSVIDVQDIGCDFLCFTGHKLYGPTGSGILYGRYSVLEGMPPYQGGGDMITSVGFGAGETQFQQPPHRFEAGTPSFIDVIGLGAAIDYVQDIGLKQIQNREHAVFQQLIKALQDIEGVDICAPEGLSDEGHAPVLSFLTTWAHASDINMILDQCGVAVRTGQHCAEPLMKALGLDATMRASLGVYSDENDIERFIEALHKAKKMLS